MYVTRNGTPPRRKRLLVVAVVVVTAKLRMNDTVPARMIKGENGLKIESINKMLQNRRPQLALTRNLRPKPNHDGW